MMFSELYTNADGRLSTTAFIQFFGAILMAAMLCFCVWLDRPYVPEMFMYQSDLIGRFRRLGIGDYCLCILANPQNQSASQKPRHRQRGINNPKSPTQNRESGG